jgi:hypothetical protein
VTNRTTIVQACADLYTIVKDVNQDGVTVTSTAPLPNQRPAGPCLYISPDMRESPDHLDWQLTLELSIQLDQPGFAESQEALRRIIDAVEAAFDSPPSALPIGIETVWQSTTRTDLGCYVCSWNVTIPIER